MADDEIALHYATVPIAMDGDCWINAVLINYSVPPSVSATRAKIKALVEHNDEFCTAMDVSKESIASVHKRASYSSTGRLRHHGAWGEYWHMPALAIILGVDIISFADDTHFSYYCSSGVNLYHPPSITIDEVIARRDIVAIVHNGLDHFDALLPTQKNLKLPSIPWHTPVARTPVANRAVCDFCDTACEQHDAVACAVCGSVCAHAICVERLHCSRFVCDECD